MAAALAEGQTILENSACEPEVTDLIALLRKMGAKVSGDETPTLHIQGVSSLHGAEHSVIADRIEAGTFLVAGAITNGDLSVTNCEPRHLGAIISKLRDAGVSIEDAGSGSLRVRGAKRLVAADLTTEEYPGFASDMQAQYMALATQSEGASTITETIFENRYLHASEMIRMGAHISIDGRRAIVRGPTQLSGTTVQASDLRASASLVLAALVANRETVSFLLSTGGFYQFSYQNRGMHRCFSFSCHGSAGTDGRIQLHFEQQRFGQPDHRQGYFTAQPWALSGNYQAAGSG